MKKTVQIITALIVLVCLHSHMWAQTIETYAGTGYGAPSTGAFSGDGGPATAADFYLPSGLAMDGSGNTYIGDLDNGRVRMINSSGIISTIAGNGGFGYYGSGVPATSATFYGPFALALDGLGNLYICDQLNLVIRQVNLTSGIITTVAGTVGSSSYTGDGGAATNATFGRPLGIAADNLGNFYIADQGNNCVRKVDASGIITTVVGNGTGSYGGDGGPASSANLWKPNSVCLDGAGNLYISDYHNNRIRKVFVGSGSSITGADTIITFAGNGTGSFYGDGSPATAAEINLPLYVASDYFGNIFISDNSNGRIRKVNSSGIITTFAGDGTYGWLGQGDGGPATNAKYTSTDGIASDCKGNIYFSDIQANRVREVLSGTIVTSSSTTVCVGSTIALSDGTPGGTWSSSNTSVASVSPFTGVVSGISAGTATISYTVSTGCSSTIAITVSPLPAAMIGTMHMCVGATTTVVDATGGGSWTSDNTSIATIGPTTGTLTGISAGTTTITYTLPSGCYITGSVTTDVTPATITGTLNVCLGATSTLSNSITGGTWSSSNTSVATVGSTTGVVSGISSGIANITYTLSTGCTAIATVTVAPLPTITGTDTVCVGLTTTLSDATFGGLGGGLWTSSSTGIAVVGSLTGVVMGVAAGTATITYTLFAGCISTTTVTVTIPPAITGTTTFCKGAATTLSNTEPGGIWTSSSTGVATVGSSSGVVSGIASGTAVISYTLPTGCYVTTMVSVVAAAAITGTMQVCAGSTTTLSDGGGGTWTSSNHTIATIGSSSGIVTGVAAGTATITYTLPLGCTTTAIVTVNPLPAAITGPTKVCVASTITLSDATSGGTWSSSNPLLATAGSLTGTVTGVSGGIPTITYTLPAGCYVTYTVTVDTLPDPILGYSALCLAYSNALADSTPGGLWSSSNTAIVNVGSTSGVMHTVSLGTAVITYTLVTGCYVTTTVSPLAISGLHDLCAWGDTLTVSSAPGGIYSSTGVTVTGVSGGAGTVTAFAPGIDTIFYTYPTGCVIDSVITTNPLPTVITGALDACSGGTTVVGDATPGGTWSSSATSIATVGSLTGVVTGVSSGRTYIIYTLPTGCSTDTPLIVNPAPAAIAGNGFMCIGSTITLTDGIPGGTWSSGNPSVATIGSSSGIVTGVATGTATITYTLCSNTVTAIVTVSALTPITGPTSICVGTTVTLSDAIPGGIWSSASLGIGSIDPSGDVTGIATGTAYISYKVTAGCIIYDNITVNAGGIACTPCSMFSGYTPLGSTGHITGNVGAGNYYIGNNVTVTGNDTFDNAIVMIGAGDTIFIDTASSLTIDSSHLFSLCNEWAGMEMKVGVTHSARLFVKQHSLVEDAMCAVHIPSPATPASGNVFESEASVFNQNVVGINIQYYNATAMPYPFMVHNTVITCRDFTGYTGYPYQWPMTMGAGGLKTYLHAADTFTAPFNVMSYSPANCPGGLLPWYGIVLDSVGNYYTSSSPLGLIIPAQYNEITIGDTTTTTNDSNQNLIDNMQVGIYATNSNVTSVNNAFTNIFSNGVSNVIFGSTPPPPSGSSIYAAVTNDLTNPNRLRVYRPAGSTYRNFFYGFGNAVEAHNYLQVIAQNNYLINKTPTGGGTTLGVAASGLIGFLVKTAKYDTIDISNNTVNNVGTGVSISMMYDPIVWLRYFGTGGGFGFVYWVSVPSQYMDYCNISNNALQAQPDWIGSITGNGMNLGISYQNPYIYHPPPIFTLGTPVVYAQNLSINNNGIHDAYDGIYVNNYAAPRSYVPSISQNSIWLRIDSAVTRKPLQYGINNTLCNNSRITYNNVQGTLASADANDSMRAFYMASNTGADLGCNNELQIGRGYEFFLTNLGTDWHNNTMSDNVKGFVLNGGVIGPQTNGSPVSSATPISDAWLSWGSSNFQTFVIQADPSHSPLYTDVTQVPTVNGGNPARDAYGIVANSLYTATGPWRFCPIVTGPDGVPLNEAIAEEHVNYVYSVVPPNWIAQYALWKATVLDSSLVDSSTVVAEFAAMADSVSRFRYLTDIETALGNGDLVTANTLLAENIDTLTNTAYDTTTGVHMADDTTTDFIVQNYQQFYKLYIKYETGVFTEEDSTTLYALAQLCPEINGGIVYQARALYSGIFNDFTIFNDDSCLGVDSTYIGERHAPTVQQTNTQQYMLWPNPNNGSLTLGQRVPDGEPVKAEIWNEVGMTVYRDELLFNGGIDQLHMMNASPGLYLLHLTDSKNRQFTLKFVIQ